MSAPRPTSRLPLVLALTACLVMLALTPPASAAARWVAKALYAKNAGKVGGIQAARTPTANKLVPLAANRKFPTSVIPLSLAPGATTYVKPATVGVDCTGSRPGYFCYDSANEFRNAGNGLGSVGYYKDALGNVHLRGSADLTAHGAGGSSVMFYLPVGSRPLGGSQELLVPGCGTAPTNTLVIQTEGAVYEADSIGCVSLDGVVFRP